MTYMQPILNPRKPSRRDLNPINIPKNRIATLPKDPIPQEETKITPPKWADLNHSLQPPATPYFPTCQEW